jgi:hypothetical protein
MSVTAGTIAAALRAALIFVAAKLPLFVFMFFLENTPSLSRVSGDIN